MAGEMTRSEVRRESYPLHFAIADAFGGTVQPFDQYQGPYVAIGPDVRGGGGVYATAPRLPGTIRLWIQAEGDSGFVTVYNEDNEKQSKPFPWNDSFAVVDAAASVLPRKVIQTTPIRIKLMSTQFLIDTLKEILSGDRIVYDDGLVTFGALDVELIERAVHNVDESFQPTRPDSAVMPCVHGCDYCKNHDTPSN